MRSTRAICSKVLLLACAGAFAETPPAHDFSADIVSRDTTGAPTGDSARVFVSNGRVRLEISNIPTGYFLIDGAAALFVRPARQVFMDARQSSRLTQIFLPVDPTNPCSQWQAAASNAGVPNTDVDWLCKRIDDASADSHDTTVQYTVVSSSPGKESTQRWIDTTLRFPVKMRQSNGITLALEHIRFEAQPASLFTLPPGYRKSDPRALIERIKQSDVWVEPPKQ